MRKAEYSDKNFIVDILTDSFETNQSVNYIVKQDKKKTTLKSILLDIKLILSCIGLSNIIKALNRESKIKAIQPKELMYYLWFIGVDPKVQNSSIGTELLDDIIKDINLMERPIYLETSTLMNLPWYRKFGFDIYNELDLSYKLFFLRKEVGIT